MERILFNISRQISGKFRSHEIFREIWNRSSGRQISRKFRSHEISRQIWNRSSGAVLRNFQKISGPKFPGNLGVKFSGNFIHTKFPDKFGTGALGLYSEIFRKFRGPKFPGNFGVGNIWQLIFLFAPTSPRQPVPKFPANFALSRLPAQIFPEILGQETFGDYSLRFSPQNSSEILGRETLLHEITRDLKFLGNFGTVRPKFSGNFWNEFFLISRVKFVGHFVHTKFSEKFGTGALGVKFPGNFVHTKFPDKFGTGALGLSCEMFRISGSKFSGNFRSRLPAQIFLEILGQQTFGNYSLCFSLPNSPGILGRETLLREITRGVKFLGNFGTAHSKISRKFWNELFLFSRVKFLANFVHIEFSDKFGTGALGLYSEIF